MDSDWVNGGGTHCFSMANLFTLSRVDRGKTVITLHIDIGDTVTL